MKIVFQARMANLHGCEIDGEINVADDLSEDAITALIRDMSSQMLTVIWTDMRSGKVVRDGPAQPDKFIEGN